MDNKIKDFHHKITFDLFKNIIIEQNKLLLKKVSEESGLDEDYLLEKYIQPAYYLPVISKTLEDKDKKDNKDKK
jgi:hypothetical protein